MSKNSAVSDRFELSTKYIRSGSLSSPKSLVGSGSSEKGWSSFSCSVNSVKVSGCKFESFEIKSFLNWAGNFKVLVQRVNPWFHFIII